MAMISSLHRFRKSVAFWFVDKHTASGAISGKALTSWSNGSIYLWKSLIMSKSGENWLKPKDFSMRSLTCPKFIDPRYFLMLWNKKLVDKRKSLSTSWKSSARLINQTPRFMSSSNLWFYKVLHIKEMSWKMRDMTRNSKKFKYFTSFTTTRTENQTTSSFLSTLTSADRVY